MKNGYSIIWIVYNLSKISSVPSNIPNYSTI